jgi:hypothetical protein
MADRTLLTPAEVAKRIEMNVDHFRRTWRRRVRQGRFPAPIGGDLSPNARARWPATRIDEYLNGDHIVVAPEPPRVRRESDDARQRATLESMAKLAAQNLRQPPK